MQIGKQSITHLIIMVYFRTSIESNISIKLQYALEKPPYNIGGVENQFRNGDHRRIQCLLPSIQSCP